MMLLFIFRFKELFDTLNQFTYFDNQYLYRQLGTQITICALLMIYLNFQIKKNRIQLNYHHLINFTSIYIFIYIKIL